MNLDNPRVNAPISQCPWIPTRVPVVCSTCLEGSLQAGAEPGPPTLTQGRGCCLGSGLGMPWAKRLGLRACWRWGQGSGGQSLATPSELERGFLEVTSSLTVRRSPALSARCPHVCWSQTGCLCLPSLPSAPTRSPGPVLIGHWLPAASWFPLPFLEPHPRESADPPPRRLHPPGPGPPGCGSPAPSAPWIPAPKVGGLGLSRWG